MKTSNTWVLLVLALISCGGISVVHTDGATGAGGTGTGGAFGAGGAGTGGKSGVGGAGTTGAGGAGTGGVGTGGVAGGTGGKAGTGGAVVDGGPCRVLCMTGRACCGGDCVNQDNDPMNCGGCGITCKGTTPLCSGGKCVTPPCDVDGGSCSNKAALCCGGDCCAAGQLCCLSEGPISSPEPTCYTPTAAQPTCPPGCAPLCVSDRDQKKNVVPVDAGDVLRRVSALPIALWTYRAEPDGVRHMGPMAQDFRASFGLGADDRTYNAVDAHGVALAAIQALQKQAEQQQRRIERLERENRELARRLRSLDRRPAGP